LAVEKHFIMTELLIYNLTLLFFIVFWGYLIIDSILRRMKIPWYFSIIILGLIAIGYRIRMGNAQSGISAIWFVLFTWIWLKKRNLELYFITRKNLIKGVLLGSFIGLGIALIYFLFYQSKLVTENVTFSEPLTKFPILIVLENAIGEELLFRSILLGSLTLRGIQNQNANWIQVALFTIAHFPRYLLTNQWMELVFVAVMGFLAGYITYKQKNVVGAVFLHAVTTSVEMLL
jgi:membrane protease YdiL (CAAX protease family)